MADSSAVAPAAAAASSTINNSNSNNNGVPDIYQTYSGKHIFVTGGSGFLGKVLLYKILKEFPDYGSVTLLMRPKKGKKPLERLSGDVLSSICFDGLKEALGPAEWQRRTAKLRVAVGDVMHEQLGMSPEDSAWLAKNVNIILHLAATVSFQEKLPISVQMNVLGTMRVLSLAKRCANLEAMVHTSTCYVNWNRHGSQHMVREQLYPLPFDPEQMCRYILGLRESEVAVETKRLLAKYRFPNTYTFTKNMAEHLVNRLKGNVPVSIVRPAIVGCALREPYPGWVDVLTAAGVVIFTIGLGVLKEFHCHGEYIADIVPVDYVVNTILKAGYKTAVGQKLSKTSRAIQQQQQQQSTSSPAADNALSSSQLVERNVRRVPTAAKGSIVGAGVMGSTSGNNLLPTNIVDAIKISTYAESEPGGQRSAGGAGNSGSGQHNNNGAGGAGGGGGGPASMTGLLGGGNNSNAESVASEDETTGMPLVFQSATSGSIRPLTWNNTLEGIVPYYRKYPVPRAISTSGVQFFESQMVVEALTFVKRELPFHATKLLANIPGALSEKQKALLPKWSKMIWRMKDINFQFRPFTNFEWRYDSRNSGRYLDTDMAPKARAAFSTDLYDINWKAYCEMYAYGIVRYFMKIKDNRPIPAATGMSGDKFLNSML